MKHANVAIFIPHAGCPHRCSFCDQRAISGQKTPPTPAQVEELLKAALHTAKDPIHTEIAFFGGSFTAIERGYMLSLLEAAKPYIGFERFSGIRISTRPDCVENEMLTLLRQYGVKTIELGAQSMRDRVLALNGRGHDSRAVREASVRIHRQGFSLGLQMMTGLYGDDEEGARYTARQFLLLSPDTVRIYPTVVLEGTLLADLVAKKEYAPPDAQASIQLCGELLKLFALQNVPVIRLGLHASGELEKKVVAGAYHPAFRELCEGEGMYLEALHALQNLENGIEDARAGRKKFVVRVRPQDVSRMIGQKRCNFLRFRDQGYDMMIRKDQQLAPLTLRVERA